MKKFFSVLVSIFVCVSLYAQKDVTKFLGIPVDGTKSEMIKRLKAKGFVVESDGLLSGEFNGVSVLLSVVTEKGKVCRVAVSYANPVSETDIRINFNNLCRQFNNNSKYMSLGDFTIPESEDISIEMGVHNKRYEAAFCQLPEGETLETFLTNLRTNMEAKYSSRDWWNPRDEMLMNEIFHEEITKAIKHKSVWFMINEFYGKYYITIYYDNELNRSQGEDL